VLADDYIDESVSAIMAEPERISHLPAARQALEASRARLEGQWQVYQALPVFPGERQLGTEVARMKAELSRDLSEALDAVDRHRPLIALDLLQRRAKPDAD